MKRRALLAGVAGGATLLAGCARSSFVGDSSPTVHSATGTATVRPLDEPYVRHGMSTETEQYLHARLYESGSSLPVTDAPEAADLAATVDGLSDDEFALLTNVRTAAAAPAYLWPSHTEWREDQLSIELARKATSFDGTADEVVGVALAVFEVDGEPPTAAEVVFPGGATLPV